MPTKNLEKSEVWNPCKLLKNSF